MCILFDHPHRRDEFGRHRNRFAAPDADDADDGLQLRDRHVELAAAVRADDPQCRLFAVRLHGAMLSRRSDCQTKTRRSGLCSTSLRPRQISAPSAAGTAVTGNGMKNADPASQCMPMNAQQWRGANWAISRWVMRIRHRGGIVPTPVAEPQPEDGRFFCKTRS